MPTVWGNPADGIIDKANANAALKMALACLAPIRGSFIGGIGLRSFCLLESAIQLAVAQSRHPRSSRPDR